MDAEVSKDERRLCRTAKSCGASAADLKFLQNMLRVHSGTSNRERHWIFNLANALAFRSS